MKSTTAAGTPAAGLACARVSNSTHSTEANMTSQTNTNTPGSTADADFTLLSEHAVRLADQLDMDIIGYPGGIFSAHKDGDFISDELTSEQLDQWLMGYECGRDDPEMAVQIACAGLTLAELVKAETIIQTCLAQMSDAQKEAANDSLVACGFRDEDAVRCEARRTIIASARAASDSAS